MRACTALLCLYLLPAPTLAERVLFDAHLHYNRDHAAALDPDAVLAILKDTDVVAAAVTGSPPEQVLALYRRAPEHIVPLLGVYRDRRDKADWWRNTGLPRRVAAQLAKGPWRGLGELHLFAEGRRSPVFLALVDLAADRDLPLLMHCDPAVIDALFSHRPDARVIWAHAGAYPHPDLLRDYLDRYPQLSVDLSVRDARIAPGGQLRDDWAWLLTEYSDRFMVGVDTYRAERWSRYGALATAIRGWLDQLPDGVAAQIARSNAVRVFSRAR